MYRNYGLLRQCCLQANKSSKAKFQNNWKTEIIFFSDLLCCPLFYSLLHIIKGSDASNDSALNKERWGCVNPFIKGPSFLQLLANPYASSGTFNNWCWPKKLSISWRLIEWSVPSSPWSITCLYAVGRTLKGFPGGAWSCLCGLDMNSTAIWVSPSWHRLFLCSIWERPIH